MPKAIKNKPVDLKLYFLVMRVQVGNDQAFRELYELFNKSSLRFLQNLVKGDEAQDLNQDLWLTIYKQIAGLSEPKRFKTWLFQIARNKALDYFRSAKRMGEFHEMMAHDSEVVINPLDDDLALEKNTLLYEALATLSTKLREAIALNFLEGMDYEEIALITGCSIGTVKSRLHNAKLKIKELIKTKIEES